MEWYITKSVYSFKPTEENLVGTINWQLFNHLNNEGKLSDSDFKNCSISLELYIYEVEIVHASQYLYGLPVVIES